MIVYIPSKDNIQVDILLQREQDLPVDTIDKRL
jgi:hypothetical protein